MEEKYVRRRFELLEECVVPEGALAEVNAQLVEFMQPFVEAFKYRSQGECALTCVRGLCSDLAYKNAESIAYLFGEDRQVMQHFIGDGRWDDASLRSELARQVGGELGEADGVLAFDPSSFAKKGDKSVGVKRQWCGRLGKLENCQVAVYLAYVSAKGHALVDTELFLPQEWTKDRWRLKSAGVPKERWKHRTRHQLCLDLLDRHGQTLPHSWITGDDELGRSSDFRLELQARNERYLLAVPSNTLVREAHAALPEWCGNGRPSKVPHCRADAWLKEQPRSAWTQIEVRDGEKGPLQVEGIKCRVITGKRGRRPDREETLVVIRYHDRDSKVLKTDYYLSNAGKEVTLAEFARAAHAEHRIEECFQRAKSQAGLADYEVRNWRGWQHHQTLSLIACWFLTCATKQAEKKDPGNHDQSSENRDRHDPAKRTSLRYTTIPQLAHRTAPQKKSTG